MFIYGTGGRSPSIHERLRTTQKEYRCICIVITNTKCVPNIRYVGYKHGYKSVTIHEQHRATLSGNDTRMQIMMASPFSTSDSTSPGQTPGHARSLMSCRICFVPFRFHSIRSVPFCRSVRPSVRPSVCPPVTLSVMHPLKINLSVLTPKHTHAQVTHRPTHFCVGYNTRANSSKLEQTRANSSNESVTLVLRCL